jgi:hypothetical protein
MIEVVLVVLAVGAVWLLGLVVLVRLLSFNQDESESRRTPPDAAQPDPADQPETPRASPDPPGPGSIGQAS